MPSKACGKPPFCYSKANCHTAGSGQDMKEARSRRILKLKEFLVCLSLLPPASPASCLESLPPCAGSDVSAWSDCIGTTSVDGETYRGAFQMGRRHGEGTLVARDGSVYTGEFRDNKKQGMGVTSNIQTGRLTRESSRKITDKDLEPTSGPMGKNTAAISPPI